MPNCRVARALKNATSHQGTSKGINSKRKRLSDSFESELEQDVQMVKRRPGRPHKNSISTQGTSQVSKTARFRRKAEKGAMDSKKDDLSLSSSSSSSELESDSDETDVVEGTDNEETEETI
ncbi:hypothetical protein B9Z55_023651 [Caenorhabditis nigoni]|uniref:Uncharacterized protein n=1 Tax=Caenorhabditis nigoni TaxID=1611254 RepID=A0A2G5SRB5_9PELO|nr:hypothetical protein B9Z55_023649 [Caenorhabditis nigoni]PIC17394.1 hypothetical protein B9Z55_023651 [Caenorhabditis nigoni]